MRSEPRVGTTRGCRASAPAHSAAARHPRVVPTLVRLLAVTLMALGVPPVVAGAQQTPRAPPADTLPADSTFAHAGPVLRWNVAARALVERAIAARGSRPARPTFYDGNNNTRIYALVDGAQYDAFRAAEDPREEDVAAVTD